MKNIIAIVLFISIMSIPVFVFGQTVGGGDLTFKPKGAEQVLFSHKVHISDKALKCTSCHYHVFQMSKDSKKMDMSKMTKGDFCGKCHNGQKSFDVKDAKNCSKCHKK